MPALVRTFYMDEDKVVAVLEGFDRRIRFAAVIGVHIAGRALDVN